MLYRNLFVAMTLLFALPAQAADGFIDYEPGVIAASLKRGESVLVDYAADWCSTCKVQERVIQSLQAEDPSLKDKITFIRVDWDTFKDHAVRKSRNIPRRSTLIMLKGDQELGRIVAGTGRKAIHGLINKGL